MTLGVELKGSGARGSKSAAVTSDQELLVTVSPHPPIEEQRTHPFNAFLTDDGTESGSSDLGQDGSITPIEFWVPSLQVEDRYITSLSIVVGYGTTGQPFQFADAAALTNGVRIYYVSERGEREIFNAKSNQDFFRLASTQMRTNWEVRGIGALNDFGYFIDFDLTRLMPPYGVKLDRGENQRLAAVVRDDATNADIFTILAFGFDRFRISEEG